MMEKIESSPRIPKARGDLDQAIRYLKGADEMLSRSGVRTYLLRREIDITIKQLLPEDQTIAGLAGNIGALRILAKHVREAVEHDAATEILKAVAVLRDKTP